MVWIRSHAEADAWLETLSREPTIEPRVKPIPVRIPLPQPDARGSIYEIQKGLKNRGFGIYDDGGM